MTRSRARIWWGRLRTPALVTWGVAVLFLLPCAYGYGCPSWVLWLTLVVGVSTPAAGVIWRLVQAVRGLVRLIRGVSRDEVTSPRSRSRLAPAANWGTSR